MQKMMENRLQIDWTYHEADMARMERINKRLWKALLFVIVLLVATKKNVIYKHEYLILKCAKREQG